MSPHIQTVTGPVPLESFGVILPHEHVFTDLRGPLAPGYASADPEAVVRLILPFLESAYAAGISAMAECSTVGVGRNVPVLRRLAAASPMKLIAPTGVYREAFNPPSLRNLGAETLADMWVRDLADGIDGSEVRAGFIKIAVSDDGPSLLEERNLKAAALASQRTGAVVASHTIGGGTVRREIAVLEAAGLDLRRFIWVHAQAEPDQSIHLDVARRGAYVEFDTVGGLPGQSWMPQVDYTLALVAAGLADRILLSHDAGWYDPGQPDGVPEGGVRGYTPLMEEFVPALRARGLQEAVVRLITVTNPVRAFALP
jgi:phosphotriesterase-related protein